MDSAPVKTLPFSRPLDVATVGDAGVRQTVVADEQERRRVADADGLNGIESLVGEFRLRRDGRWGLSVTGEVKARIRQTCVVTLEEFETDVVEPVDVRFMPSSEIEAEAARRARVVVASGDEDEQPDLPDPIVNGRIDLGALVGEFLALGLDPYPKKPGTTFVEPLPPSEESADVSPFAVLGKFKTS